MICTDLELTGLNPIEKSIWQIGAIDVNNPTNIFFGECRIRENEKIPKSDKDIIGLTESELKDIKKQTEKNLLKSFFDWVNKNNGQLLICQNPFDYTFLLIKSIQYGLHFPFHHRIFDTHSIASATYFNLNKKFKLTNNHSGLGLTESLKFCGLEDLGKRKIPHNALEDAKLTAEVFYRLVFGKNLLEKFKNYKIPEYLIDKSKFT